MNFLEARLERENGGYTVTFGKTHIYLDREAVGEAKENGRDLARYAGKVILGIRPEHIEDARLGETAANGEGSNTMEVEPRVIESMGNEKYVYFSAGREQTAQLESVTGMAGTDDTEGDASAGDISGNLMVARVPAGSQVRLGEKMPIVLDPGKVKLFDPESEEAIL